MLWNAESLRLASAVNALLPLSEPWNNNSFHLNTHRMWSIWEICASCSCLPPYARMATAANQQNKEVGKWEFSVNATGFLNFLEIKYRHCSTVGVSQSWGSVSVPDTRCLSASINFRVCSKWALPDHTIHFLVLLQPWPEVVIEESDGKFRLEWFFKILSFKWKKARLW